jgi:hypothetical protein
VRKVGAERPGWFDYEDFEDFDDVGDGGFGMRP